MGIHSSAFHIHRIGQKRKEVFLVLETEYSHSENNPSHSCGEGPSICGQRGITVFRMAVFRFQQELFSEEVAVLFRSQRVDFASPVSQFATGHLLVDFQWHIIDHMTWFTADLTRILRQISRAESLDGK